MTRLLPITIIIALAGTAAADQRESRLERIRRAYEQKDYVTVRRELRAAYEEAPDPQLLFALGQVELNLGNYEAAIRYYEKFITTSPSDEQIALAQQAIGAARYRLAQPPDARPPPPPPPRDERPRVPPRQWYTEDTGLVTLGAAAMLVGGGLLYYSHRLGNDRSGTLAQYHERVELSRTTRWTGIGVAATGALVVGVTLVRWRLRPDGTDLAASIAPGSATFVLTGRW